MNREALLAEPPVPFGAVCCRCGRWSGAAVACRRVERAGGPGVTLYACPRCVFLVGAGPMADEVIRGGGDTGRAGHSATARRTE